MDIIFRNLTSSKKYSSKFFEKILSTCIRELKIRKNISVSVNIVGEGRIRELNRQYRYKDKVTDVLSFPMSKKFSRKLHTTYYILHTTDLGDIFICLSFAKKEAKSENISIEKKLAQLTVHGFLHLVGYDHEKSREEANKMSGLESRILKRMNLG
jgi:probable rRNA maturation factor